MRNKANSRYASRSKSNTTEDKMVDLMDQLMEFQDFREKILPALQADLKSGASAKELREKYAALVQARIITEAITSPKAGDALFAGKDILDRAHGRATEKKEVTHRFDSLSDEELDAVLQSETEELDNLQERFEQ